MKWLGVVWCFISLALYAANGDEQQNTLLRIQPIGQVSVQQEEASRPAAAVKKGPEGQQTYEHYCIVCHQGGLAGAPKFRNETDWKPRLSGRSLDDLVASSIKGLNAMPTKGTCLKCSEEDLKAAISYMLPQS